MYCPSFIERLPSRMLFDAIMFSSCPRVRFKASSFSSLGMIIISLLISPLMSAMATSGNCSSLLLITLAAKRLNSRNCFASLRISGFRFNSASLRVSGLASPISASLQFRFEVWLRRSPLRSDSGCSALNLELGT